MAKTIIKMMLAHFKGYEDVVGDHPLNLVATTLAHQRLSC